MPNPADDFLTGTTIPGIKLEAVGDFVEGQILEPPVMRQQTEMGTGTPKVFDSGQPMMQLVVTIQTQERLSADDDGRRKVYVKGSKDPATGSMRAAVTAAVLAAGAPGLEVGGWLRVARGQDRRTNEGFTAHTFQANYRRPNGSDFLSQAPAAQPQVSQQVLQQHPTQPATPATPQVQVQQAPQFASNEAAAAYGQLSPTEQARLAGLYANTPGNQPPPSEPPF